MTAWVLVADRCRATLFSAVKAMSPLEIVETFDHPESRTKNGDHVSDRPRRSGNGTSGLDHNEGPVHREAVAFARELCDRLRQGRHSGDFDRLYIAAAPAFLGMLREKLDTTTAQLVAGAISKDLTRQPVEAVRDHLPHRL